MNHLRRKIVDLAYKAKEGHIASSLSILDILYVLYHNVLDIESIRSGADDRDRFILSKGHGALALYVILNDMGLISDETLETYCRFDSPLGGHPKRNIALGIEASTGSLGHGFPMAVGMALGYKVQGYKSKIYCLIGDGEANEGSIWESALLAAHHQLDNLVLIVDNNGSSYRTIRYAGSMKNAFKGFGFNIEDCVGHNHNDLDNVFYDNYYKFPDRNRPKVIIAYTTKGKGIQMMEDNPAWHHRIPTEEEYILIMKELE